MNRELGRRLEERRKVSRPMTQLTELPGTTWNEIFGLKPEHFETSSPPSLR